MTFAAGFGQPQHLAFDVRGNFYVADFNGNTIRRFAPSGAPLGSFASGLDRPVGIVLPSLPIQTIDLGLSEVDIFVGYTDPDSGALATAADDGELTEAELEQA